MSRSAETPGSDCKGWPSLAGLLTADRTAPVALLGAPLAGGSLTPGRCDLAPGALRAALPRIGVYDVETGTDLSAVRVFDAGDLDLRLHDPASAFAPVRDAAAPLLAGHALLIAIGGNNAVTRPLLHAHGLDRAGLLTIDAHFDLRDTDCGLTNGNPVQALLQDGLPGARIAQLGLAPYANTAKAHAKAKAAGIAVVTLRDCRGRLAERVQTALDTLSAAVGRIHVDFDIDAIDRAQMPAAPGARPGGLAAHEFFEAAEAAGAHPGVRSVDLTEFDPALDLGGLGALTAARWFAAVLAGFSRRPTAPR